MGKRFIRTPHADQRAIRLHLMLREIEQMPMICVEFSKDHKSIIFSDRNNPQVFKDLSVDFILGLNPKGAMEKGGSYAALLDSWRRPATPVPRSVVEEEVHSFLRGED